MAFKLPETPPQDTAGKISAILQTVLFLVLLTVSFVTLCKVVHGFFFRVLLFIGLYAVMALFAYLVLKPLFAILEEKFRNRK